MTTQPPRDLDLPRPRLYLLMVAIAIAMAVYAAASRGLLPLPIALVAKPLPAIALGLALLGASGDRYRRAIGVGLLASAVGDLLLELGPEHFLLGVAAFFVAHVLYIAAFWRARPALRPLAALPAVAWGLYLFPQLAPGLGGLYWPVLIYSVALCAMLWRALALLPGAAGESRAARAGALGALLFVASDSLLAWDRFHVPVDNARVWIMATYWAGQLGIFLSAYWRPLDRE